MHFANFAILQLVHMTFLNLFLARMTFVNHQLVRMTSVRFQLARMTTVNFQLARMTFVTFVNLLLVHMTFVNLQLVHMIFVIVRLDCTLDFVDDLRLDEDTAFLDERFVSFTVLQEGLSREVCFNSVFAQVTDTQDRFCHLHYMEVISSQAVSDS